jgi:hypothetical protein
MVSLGRTGDYPIFLDIILNKRMLDWLVFKINQEKCLLLILGDRDVPLEPSFSMGHQHPGPIHSDALLST